MLAETAAPYLHVAGASDAGGTVLFALVILALVGGALLARSRRR